MKPKKNRAHCGVLILIILEVGFEYLSQHLNSLRTKSLNPYYSGSRNRIELLATKTATLSLVLILVILEVGIEFKPLESKLDSELS